MSFGLNLSNIIFHDKHNVYLYNLYMNKTINKICN